MVLLLYIKVTNCYFSVWSVCQRVRCLQQMINILVCHFLHHHTHHPLLPSSTPGTKLSSFPQILSSIVLLLPFYPPDGLHGLHLFFVFFGHVLIYSSAQLQELLAYLHVGFNFGTVCEVSWLRLSCRSGCLIHNSTCIRVGKVSRVRVTFTVTVRVSRVSVMVSVSDSVK